jgi:uncharacterized membrane protein YjjP (DUF1212 family)
VAAIVTKDRFSPWRRVLDTTLCDKICLGLVAGRWFSLGISFFIPIQYITDDMAMSTRYTLNKNERHYITNILLQVALITIRSFFHSKQSIIWIVHSCLPL